MSITPLPTPSNLEELPRHPMPTMYDLPSENPEDPGLPDDFHSLQAILLLLTFQPFNWDPEMIYSQIDHNIYYDLNHPLWYKRPDWFGVVGVPRLYQGRDMRLSYVMWQENVSPLIVVELLSPGTEDEDLGRRRSAPGKPPTKWQVYEKILQVPYYVIFSRYTEELQVFRLVRNRYQMVALTQEPLQIPEIQLSLGLWRGSYLGRNQLWLRWMTESGDLIAPATDEATEALLSEEKADFLRRLRAAEQEKAAAEQEKAAAEQEKAEAQQRAAAAEREKAAAEREKAEAQQRAAAAEQEKAEAQQRAAAAEREKAEVQQQLEQLKALLQERGINPDRQT